MNISVQSLFVFALSKRSLWVRDMCLYSCVCKQSVSYVYCQFLVQTEPTQHNNPHTYNRLIYTAHIIYLIICIALKYACLLLQLFSKIYINIFNALNKGKEWEIGTKSRHYIILVHHKCTRSTVLSYTFCFILLNSICVYKYLHMYPLCLGLALAAGSEAILVDNLHNPNLFKLNFSPLPCCVCVTVIVSVCVRVRLRQTVQWWQKR